MGFRGIHRFEDLSSTRAALREAFTGSVPSGIGLCRLADHPAMDSDLIRLVFHSEDDGHLEHKRRALLEHAEFPEDLLEAALVDERVRWVAVQHPACTPELVARVWPSHQPADRTHDLSLSGKQLDELAKDPDNWRRIAGHPNALPETLRYIARNAESVGLLSICSRILANPSVDAETLLVVEYESSYGPGKALVHPNFPAAKRVEALRDETSGKRRFAAMERCTDNDAPLSHLRASPNDYTVTNVACSTDIRAEVAVALVDEYIDQVVAIADEEIPYNEIPAMVVENVCLNPDAPRHLINRVLAHRAGEILAFDHSDDLLMELDPSDPLTREVYEIALTTDRCVLSSSAAQFVPYADLAELALQHEKASVRSDVSWAIGNSRNPEVRRLGERVMRDPDERVRIRFIATAEQVEQDAFELALVDKNPEVRRLARTHPLARRPDIERSPNEEGVQEALEQVPIFDLLERIGCRMCGRPDMHTDWEICDQWPGPLAWKKGTAA